ncbi:MAG: hypothetical protein IV101_01865 [Dechloromonas sp.]|uniref:hypothetical protein n=1 Tax=Azonexaceae TaxID=2008795 RepID=UPI001CF83F63|nr:MULTISPECIES: hypothetical protein [Azonexaceae]MBT9519616.1 hypothetical protein [Dechloromonas sp.]UCV24574.1 hypothetical protein KI613_08725 [Ferribacterium limneticum]
MNVVDNLRGRQERRQFDSVLAAGHFDRRHIIERRRPEMEILRLSDIDWQAYFGDSPRLSEKSLHKIAQEADAFNKTHSGQR